MASAKRQAPAPEEDKSSVPNPKKSRLDDVSEPTTKRRVVLNPADCNLDFCVEANGLGGYALHEKGFAYCWSGARANVGITGGKYCFGCKIVSVQPVEMEDTPPDQQHLCRVGVSMGNEPVGKLGETDCSFGYGGTGRFSCANMFVDYGERFGVGDTIVCTIDLESKPLATVGFSKNGKWLGTAKQFDANLMGIQAETAASSLPWEPALFPHVLLKNVVVEMQFSFEDGLFQENGFKPWSSALDDEKAIIGPVFTDVSHCEVMMMVGLPASGKTTWAEKWIKIHPEKRYVLLGTNLALDQMKVPGLVRKGNYAERFDRLMERATDIFNTLLTRAAKTPRNYILDQTNVYKSARKRKLKPFASFYKVAVVVFPRPEELKLRAQKRFKEMGKEVPADALNQMIDNYVLPTSVDMPGSDEYFDKVIFAELDRSVSQRHLDEMKQSLLHPSNLDLKKDYSSISRETSVQSCSSLQRHQVSSVSGGQWENSYMPSPPLNPCYRVPNQVGPYQGYQQSCVPRSAAPRGNVQGSFHLPDGYGFSGTESPISSPSVRTDYYQMHSLDRSFNGSNMAYNSIHGAYTRMYQNSRAEPFSLGPRNVSSVPGSPAYAGHFSGTGDPAPFPNTARVPAPTRLPPPPYGLPHTTPTLGTSYMNSSPDVPRPRGYAPPYPRYY